jgi:hypothetical protein
VGSDFTLFREHAVCIYLPNRWDKYWIFSFLHCVSSVKFCRFLVWLLAFLWFDIEEVVELIAWRELCSNKFLRSVPMELGVLQLGPYLKFWALFYVGLTAWIAIFKKEEADHDQDVTVSSTYSTIYSIIRLPRM